LELSDANKLWQEIDNYFMIRHCVVHCNALVNEYRERDSLINYLKSKKILGQDSFDDTPIVELTSEFCEEVVETMQKFVDAVYQAYVKAGVFKRGMAIG
jgi:hypothetical protein